MSEDFEIDDLIAELDKAKKKKKKPKSGEKGKRGERELRDILAARFNQPFARVIGSGNGWARGEVPKHAKESQTGDLICPERFRFTIECKYGYEETDLAKILMGDYKPLDEFLDQARKDSDRIGKQPLLCWRKTRKGFSWLAFLPVGCYEKVQVAPEKWHPFIHYKGWIGLSLETLLAQDDSFFFTTC